MEKKTIAALVGAGAVTLTMGSASALTRLPESPQTYPQEITRQVTQHSTRLERRLQSLQRALRLSSEQVEPWQAFAEARMSIASERTQFRDSRQWVDDAQERLELRAERARIRAEQLAAIAKARRSLIEVLSPSQRATLDRMTGPKHVSAWKPRQTAPQYRDFDREFDEL